MKITVNELRNGTIIYRNQQIMQVLEFQHMNEICRVKVMNFSTHKKQELDIQAKETIEKIVPDIFRADLASIDGDLYQFFNTNTYDFIEIKKSAISNTKWMIENSTCILHSYNGEVYHVETDRYVQAKVIKIEPGFNPIATLENGIKLEVDSHVRAGDLVRVDTMTEKYVNY